MGLVFAFGCEVFELLEEALGGAYWFVVTELGGKAKEAVLGIVGDLGDWLAGFLTRVGFRQVETGDLEAVEQETCAPGVDLVGRDATQNFADRLLDGAAVLRVGKGEAGLAAPAGGDLLDGAAGVVVKVTEGLGTFRAAEGRAAAATAVGEEMAALEDGGFGVGGGDDFGCHVWPLPGVFCAKSRDDVSYGWTSGVFWVRAVKRERLPGE